MKTSLFCDIYAAMGWTYDEEEVVLIRPDGAYWVAWEQEGGEILRAWAASPPNVYGKESQITSHMSPTDLFSYTLQKTWLAKVGSNSVDVEALFYEEGLYIDLTMGWRRVRGRKNVGIPWSDRPTWQFALSCLVNEGLPALLDFLEERDGALTELFKGKT